MQAMCIIEPVSEAEISRHTGFTGVKIHRFFFPADEAVMQGPSADGVRQGSIIFYIPGSSGFLPLPIILQV
jgi:hypothetical protein